MLGGTSLSFSEILQAIFSRNEAEAAAGNAAATTEAPADSAAAKALAAAKGDPEKEAKIRAALEKAAALKAQREAAKAEKPE